MPAVLAEADQMTVEEFLAMAAARPDGERWELIEGVAIMNASPTDWHQRIVPNIIAALDAIKVSSNASWTPILGVGTRVPISPNSLPMPDLAVIEGPLVGESETDDALILFEVLSPSNNKADRAWRKRVYASIPNCQHYVTVATKTAEVMRFDRADGWGGTTLKGLDATLELPAIHAALPLRTLYRWTPIA